MHTASGGDILHPAAVSLVQWGFFLPCAEVLKLFRKNCAEKQAPAAGSLFQGRYIRKDFPFAKNVCKDTAHSHVIVPHNFLIIHYFKILLTSLSSEHPTKFDSSIFVSTSCIHFQVLDFQKPNFAQI